LDLLVKRGPLAYSIFLDCLDRPGQKHLKDRIKENEEKIRIENGGIYNIKFFPQLQNLF